MYQSYFGCYVVEFRRANRQSIYFINGNVICIVFDVIGYVLLFSLFQRAFCAFCQDRIWGLGRQGFKCIQCKLLVHKKCHKLVQKPCSNEQVEPIFKEETNGETPTISKLPYYFFSPVKLYARSTGV
jgi:hypothetical protein